jgi:hypothetical protein
MSTPNGGNPFTQWMNLLTSAPNQAAKQWETWVTEQMDRFVRSEPFLERMGKTMAGSFQFKAQLDRLMEQNLRAMRVPTLGDLTAVFGRIDELERRIDTLDDALEGIARTQKAILARLDAAAGVPAEAPEPKARPRRAASTPKTAPKAAGPKTAKASPAPKAAKAAKAPEADAPTTPSTESPA